jgi:hypothetical protein
MADAGYAPPECDRVQVLLRKEGIKRDAEVQALEDTICFTFIRWYFAGFSSGKDSVQVIDIVTKTARKMSAEGRARALSEFALPAELAACFMA